MIFDAAMTKELVKIVFDKLALGLLILLAGYVLNRSIETYKATQVLRNELNKQRFAAKLQRIEQQLSEFYWPVYIRLQKDNTVWRRLLAKSGNDSDPKTHIAYQIEKSFILPNHSDLVHIIETKIHLAEPNAELQDALLRYIDHVAVYSAAIKAGLRDLHGPERELLPPWPQDLFSLIEARTMALQKDYVVSLSVYERS